MKFKCCGRSRGEVSRAEPNRSLLVRPSAWARVLCHLSSSGPGGACGSVESAQGSLDNTAGKRMSFSCIFTVLADCPSGVKAAGPQGSVRGRGITRLLESISAASGSSPRSPAGRPPSHLPWPQKMGARPSLPCLNDGTFQFLEK